MYRPRRRGTKRRRRYPTRRYYKQKSAYAASSALMVVPRPRQSMAVRSLVRLRYVDVQTFEPITPGIKTVAIFTCNNMTEPDASGPGHQPMGFDQLMAFYSHYTVLGCKIKCTLANDNVPGQDTGWLFSISTRATASGYGGTYVSAEQPTARNRICTPSSGRPTQITHYFSASKYFNVKKPQDNPNLKGDVGNGPSEQAHFIVTAMPLNLTIAPAPHTLVIELEYIAFLSEPKVISASGP